jgi:hypothetical protein
LPQLDRTDKLLESPIQHPLDHRLGKPMAGAPSPSGLAQSSQDQITLPGAPQVTPGDEMARLAVGSAAQQGVASLQLLQATDNPVGRPQRQPAVIPFDRHALGRELSEGFVDILGTPARRSPIEELPKAEPRATGPDQLLLQPSTQDSFTSR